MTPEPTSPENINPTIEKNPDSAKKNWIVSSFFPLDMPTENTDPNLQPCFIQDIYIKLNIHRQGRIKNFFEGGGGDLGYKTVFYLE